MRKQVLLSSLTAATIIFGATAAEAQRDSIFKSRKSSTVGDPAQMSIDVSQYDPNVQIGEILRTTKILAQQNEQLRGELTEMRRQLDTIEARGKAIGNSLNTTTGETIGSMVNKIKLKVGVPY